jgi:hypothetical protein
LRVTFAVPGRPGAQVFRCPKTSSHAWWPGSSVRTPLTGWRQPRRLLSSSTCKLLFEAGLPSLLALATSRREHTWRLSLRCTKFRRDRRYCGHRPAPGPIASEAYDPTVWSGRAVQEVSSTWLMGLALLYLTHRDFYDLLPDDGSPHPDALPVGSNLCIQVENGWWSIPSFRLG